MNQVICFGEVLWDIFPDVQIPGGAPMNVCIVLKKLGIGSKMISKIGKDELGQKLKNYLETENSLSDFLQETEKYPTGIVQVKSNEQGKNEYTIVQPVAWDFIENNEEVKEAVKKSKAFVFGTLACRSQQTKSTLLELLKIAPFKIFDVNFRTPFYTQELVEELFHWTDFVKMNDEELQIISSWYQWENKNEKEAMEKVQQKFNIPQIVVTKGKHGADYLERNNFFTSQGYSVKVVDTVGSGDSFLAGFLKKYFEKEHPEKCLQFACATGSLVATYKGANPPITENQILNFIKSN